MNKTTTIEFRDSSIEKIRFDDLEFSYIKDGITKHRDRLYIPFNVAKKSSLKGLKLCIHKGSKSIIFLAKVV